MARKIKFALDMGNGHKARTLDDLQEYFDAEKLVTYCIDGRLAIWLKDRFFDEKAEQISQLDISDDNYLDKMYSILEINATDCNNIDIHQIRERIEKLSHLKQITEDEEILSKLEQVAFNQDDLDKIISRGYKHVYLCGDKFTLPEDKCDMTYEGILNHSNEVSINLNTKKELKEHRITFLNVLIPEKLKKDHELISYGIKKLITAIEQGFLLMTIGLSDDKVRNEVNSIFDVKHVYRYDSFHHCICRSVQGTLDHIGYKGTADDVGFYYTDSFSYRRHNKYFLCTHDKIVFGTSIPADNSNEIIDISEIKDIKWEAGGKYRWSTQYSRDEHDYNWVIINNDIRIRDFTYLFSPFGSIMLYMIKAIIAINKEPEDLKLEFQKVMKNTAHMVSQYEYKYSSKEYSSLIEPEMPFKDIFYGMDGGIGTILFSYNKIGILEKIGNNMQFRAKKYIDISDIKKYSCTSGNIQGLISIPDHYSNIIIGMKLAFACLLILMGKAYNEIFPDD